MPPFLYTIPAQAAPTSTTLPGTEITITGGPNATANIVGDKTDPLDFYGIVLVVVGIAVAILITRLVFRHRDQPHEQAR